MFEYIVLAKGSWGMNVISHTRIRSEALNAIERASNVPDIQGFIVRAGTREFEIDRASDLEYDL